MSKSKLLYVSDNSKIKEELDLAYGGESRINTKIQFFDDDTGEEIWEPLHNKTVIAGSALLAMKMFDLDRSFLNNTPTYDSVLRLDDAANPALYPTKALLDAGGQVIGSLPDESQRKIIGFCLGQGGAGLETSDVFKVKYASWIKPDDMVPFMYPISTMDKVNEKIYKGRKAITLSNGQIRNAYYFKELANNPIGEQIYTSANGKFSDRVTADLVYENAASADRAQTIVEVHLKVTREDCRDFFIAHKGLENAKINQLSLVSGWKRPIERVRLDDNGNNITTNIDVYSQIRPFSVVNIPTEILSDPEKSINIVYTLYF
jgi:hypothetical protein